MKHYTALHCLLLLAISCSSDKIAYINPAKITQQYHGTAPKQAELKVKIQELQGRLDTLLARRPPPQQIERYQVALQQQAAAEEARINKEVLDEINAYIKQYGKEKGYHLILGATEQGNLVYAAEDADLTDEVLTGLNAQYDQQHAAGK